ncbi:type I-E CRISPR-associated protein Cas7/Cse4/CasC [Oscillatoria sp. CS-180]|uniref:type I-E CRISPR-associated protein Cas7/Cse4/CasC n=1 Tax=Oscillatoria sp. CS-180 TaxID=3021720 RepID=UPI00232F68F4|nr:type I-E CRISPR-associated protein Cas7/Cse4/CasC [Oscillatoria sp. CS-180]MDB9524388.1 type I-E CRISPR-associated protein Cas7/Cse4/CasC [Oscillatoria sp. CS-180]
MQFEIHVLQSFPPANLNRDENGMPKSTVFGGRPRARISSQCQKRAVRLHYQAHSELSADQFANRSRSWLAELKPLLLQAEIAEEQAEIAAKLALGVLGAEEDPKSPGKTKTILFLGQTEIEAIANILITNWEVIAPGLTGDTPALPKKDPNIPKVIEKSLATTGKPGDVALFGRMMASLPSVNVDASVQMAHAISVNKLQQEFDFFTAVDDLSDTSDLGAETDSGADHLGETGYNSSTYYRFTVVDTQQLEKNLGSKEHLSGITQAFAEAFIQAIPTGHQNGFAAHSLPAAVMVIVRHGQPVSLVDAFENPVAPKNGMSLLENAVAKLDYHWHELTKMYGEKSVAFKGIVTREQLAQRLEHLKTVEKPTVEELLKDAIAAAFPEGE